VALAAALVGAAAAQTELQVPRGQDYVQAATGATFPARIGVFNRGRIVQYADDGTDMSAGYGRILPGEEIVVTLYVYPSPAVASVNSPPEVVTTARALTCSRQFDTVQQEIEQTYDDESLVSEGAFDFERNGVTHIGFRATYTLTSPAFMGRANTPLRSEAYLFCHVGGRWSVKYRFSYPVDYDASAQIAAFMQDWAWTIPPEPPL
jgi:hypothetical protein